MAVILIVEDEAQVLMLAESYLQEHGHRTLSASTVEQAMAVLDRTDHVDLLFTDIVLKDDHQGGLELAKQAVERKPDLKVLYVTGQTVTDGMRSLFVKDAAVLTKPYTVDQLQASLVVHFAIGPKPARSNGSTPK
jgi:DNA-binding NtrC family response regulator